MGLLDFRDDRPLASVRLLGEGAVDSRASASIAKLGSQLRSHEPGNKPFGTLCRHPQMAADVDE